MSAERCIAVMAKRPRAGAAKTRLTPPLSPEDAARLAHAFLLDSVVLAKSVPAATPAIAFSPPDPATEAFFADAVPEAMPIAQIGTNLGERLAHVMVHGLELGFRSMVATNADGPTLPASYIVEAFNVLESGEVDVVLGPAADGGYYLIGWSKPHPEVITGVTMSTPTVLADTVQICSRLGLRTALTPPWYDVDTPEDLDRLCRELSDAGGSLASNTRQALQAMGLLPADD